MSASLAQARSLLFVPGDRPERFAKAAAAGAHAVVLDLEDAVAPDRKVAARDAISAWLTDGHAGIVRINAAGTEWHAGDLAMLSRHPGCPLMLPKSDAAALAAATAALPGRPLVALLETVKGYMELPRFAALPGVVRIAFGSVDFGNETGIEDSGEAMTAIRTKIVLDSCFAGLPAPIDGVTVQVDDEAAVRADAERARRFGFGGKLCIHPRQIAAVNAAFRPGSEQVAWARRVLAAVEAAGEGASVVDGRMIDKPVVAQARRILSESGDPSP